MAGHKKGQKRRAMHPSNKYAEKPPDFSLLASKDPSFRGYVAYGSNKKPRIDWTDFNATRELTRALLEHDYGIKWWIPDGQLCPTVPNRANYIHWIEDLLSLSPAPWHTEVPSQIRGVDIGTGANCIYPLLGAALNGWKFVATDVTPVAVEWAQRNLENNPQLSEGIELRRAVCENAEVVAVSSSNLFSSSMNPPVQIPDVKSRCDEEVDLLRDDSLYKPPVQVDEEALSARIPGEEEHLAHLGGTVLHKDDQQDHNNNSVKKGGCQAGSKEDVGGGAAVQKDEQQDPNNNSEKKGGHQAGSEEDVRSDPTRNAPLLVGVIKDGEKFDFCMCNPPFFEDIQEAGLNPRTACGGTVHEMVYPGGELAFITQIVQDSLQLRNNIHWYTSMVGRKVNIKLLTDLLRASGVTMLRTTEFVQGRTSRWGIAWSFSPAATQIQVASLPGRSLGKSNISFMLENFSLQHLKRINLQLTPFITSLTQLSKGVDRKCGAWGILQALADQLRQCGATVTIDTASFSIMGTVSAEVDDRDVFSELTTSNKNQEEKKTASVAISVAQKRALSFKASVLQQAPGSLVIKASLPKTETPSGVFSSLFENVELALKKQFLKNPSRS